MNQAEKSRNNPLWRSSSRNINPPPRWRDNHLRNLPLLFGYLSLECWPHPPEASQVELTLHAADAKGASPVH